MTTTIIPPGTPLPVPTGSLTAATRAVSTVLAPPNINQNVHVDLGSGLSTIFRDAEPIVEILAEFGITAALREVPFGTLVTAAAVRLAIQYIRSASTTLEATIANLSIDVPSTNFIVDAALKMFNENEDKLAAFLGGAIPHVFQIAAAKFGLPTALTVDPDAPDTPTPGKFIGIAQ